MGEQAPVLLYHPRTFHEDNYRFYWMPYSLLALGRHLCEAGYDARVIDNNTHCLRRHRELVVELLRRCRVVGISCMIGRQITDGLEFASLVREVNPEATIVWGGHGPSALAPVFAAERVVDVVITGPGGKAFADLVRVLNSSDGSARCLPDIITGTESEYARTRTSDPDPCVSVPFYPFSLIPVADYIHDDPEVNTRTANYVSSQGCPFACGFCAEVALHRSRWSALPPQVVLNDLAFLRDAYHINGAKFYDANFFVDRKRVTQIASMMLARGLEIEWAASAHPNNLLKLSEGDWKLIASSGCSRILIGAESASQDVLDRIHKRCTPSGVQQVAETMVTYGVRGSFTFVVGFPGESRQAISRTIQFAANLNGMAEGFEAKIHFYFPYPGTPMYAEAIEAGFRPPQTLAEWAGCDYYRPQTPWVDPTLCEEIREFNEANCPYVRKR